MILMSAFTTPYRSAVTGCRVTKGSNALFITGPEGKVPDELAIGFPELFERVVV